MISRSVCTLVIQILHAQDSVLGFSLAQLRQLILGPPGMCTVTRSYICISVCSIYSAVITRIVHNPFFGKFFHTNTHNQATHSTVARPGLDSADLWLEMLLSGPLRLVSNGVSNCVVA